MRANALFTTILPLVLLLAAPLSAQDAQQPTLTVYGEGSAEAVPDTATITLGVTAQAADAADAMAQTSATAAAILERLTALGVAERDVQTSDLSLNPVWSIRPSDDQLPPKIEAFEASNRVTVRVQDLASLGDVLGAVLEDGANRLGGLSFGLKDPEPIMNEARRDAVADAVARAGVYAEAAGVTLGPILSIQEGSMSAPRPEMMMSMRDSSASMPIATGETTVSATVTMVFRIAQ